MTEKSLILADEKEGLIEVGHNIKTLLPGGEKLSNNQAISVGNYSLLTKANLYRGEIYGFKDKNGELTLVDGYKLLIRWAKEISEYDENYSERLAPGVEGVTDEDIAYRVNIVRYDKKATIREYMELGATFKEAYDIVATSAIGIVLKDEMWSKKWKKPINPPTGWSWDQVARKRALKNALNLAYAMPSLEELAKKSWFVEGIETTPQDWEDTEVYSTNGEKERHAQLAAQERQRQEKTSSMDAQEREVYDQKIESATEIMRDNGDDDHPDLEDAAPKLSPGMIASTRFWTWANNNKISRDTAGEYIRLAFGDFDAALKMMQDE